MSNKIGIGVCTYCRKKVLRRLLLRIRATIQVDYDLFVADDGSDDGTSDMLKAMNIQHQAGPHVGIARNKNRIIRRFRDYDYIFIVEDDILIKQAGWVQYYINAHKASGYNWIGLCPGGLYGNVTKTENIQGYVFQHRQYDGDVLRFLTREVIEVCGGYNPRFREAGYEHGDFMNRVNAARLNGDCCHSLHLQSAEKFVGLTSRKSTKRSIDYEEHIKANELLTLLDKLKRQTYCPIDLYAEKRYGETEMIPLLWFTGETNVGDLIGPYITERISGRCVRGIKPIDETIYLTAGSILDLAKDGRSIVWGSGFIEDAVVNIRPKKICAVRGPLTKRLVDKITACPDIFGDPALLLPKYLKIDVEKNYEIGLVPHYSDMETGATKKLEQAGVHIINPKQAVYPFVKEVLSCKKVMSSSLHGLIVADAYKVPSLWVVLSNNLYGGGFKFRDYYASIGHETIFENLTDERIDLKKLADKIVPKKLNIDTDRLLETFPIQ